MSSRARRRQTIPSDSEEEEAPATPKGRAAGKAEPAKTEVKKDAGAKPAAGGQAQDFACWNCDKSLYGCRFVNKDGHPYCVNCYNEQYANNCASCEDVISVDDKDLAFKEKHWHDKCFKCSECTNSLVGETFGAKEEKIFCGDCWDENFAPKCSQCTKAFKAGSMKLSWNSQEWHKECFTCNNCDKAIGQDAFHPQEGKPYCEECWEDLFAIKCTKCAEAIKQGGVTYKLQPYHKDCFCCNQCSKSLAGQRFTLKDDNPICADCFGTHYAKKCFECSEAITGMGGNRYIIFEDNQWHCNCFNCRECGESLVGVNFIAEGYGDELETYCQPCGFKKRGMDFTISSQKDAKKEKEEEKQTPSRGSQKGSRK